MNRWLTVIIVVGIIHNMNKRLPKQHLALLIFGMLAAILGCNLVTAPAPLVVTATPLGGENIPTANSEGVVFMVATSEATSTAVPVPLPSSPASDRIVSADQALFNGNYNLAVEIYQGIISQANTATDLQAAAYFGLGQAALREGLYFEAINALTEFITRYPTEPRVAQAYFLRGDAYIGQANWGLAIGDFEDYLRLRPGIIDSYVHERIGDSYLNLGDAQAALDAYVAASDATRSLVPLLALRERIAETYSLQGNYTAAVTQYDEILAVAQNSAYRSSIEFLAAQAELNAGLVQRGFGRMEAMLTLYPETYGAYQAMQVLLSNGFEIDSYLQAQINFANEDYGGVITALNDYQTLGGVLTPSELILLGLSHRALQNWDTAYNTFQIVLDQYPNDPLFGTAWLDQGRTRYYSGDISGAIARYSQLSVEYPNATEAPEGLWRAGYLYAFELGNLESSIAVFDQLSSLYPGNYWAQDGLLIAVSLANNLGQTTRVINFYTDLANTGTGENQAMAFLWLGKLYQSQGQTELAQQMFVGAEQADPGGYYSLRARDIRAGATPFTPPQTYQFEFDESAAIAEAEQWLRTTYNITQQGVLYTLSPTLQNDPHMIRGNELWALGIYDEAEIEFATLRTDYAGDVLATYQLAHHYSQIGLYVESIRAAADLITTAGISTYDAPSYIARLRYPVYFSDLVLPNAELYDLDPLLVFSLMRQESLFQSYATSFAYAQGLMQIIPTTGQEIAGNLQWPNYENSDLYRPYVNVRFGTYYLRFVLDYVDNVPYAALSGYNGGPGNAWTWLEASGEDFDRFVDTVAFDESRTYVVRIYQQYDIYRHLYGIN